MPAIGGMASGVGGNIGSAWITVGANTSQLVSGMGAATTSMKAFGKAALTLYAVIAAVKATTSAYVEFDRQLKNTSTLLDSTTKEITAMGNEVRAMARQYQVGSAEAQQALYHVISATFYGADALNILEEATKGAAAGLASLGATGDMLTTTLNAYRMSASETAKINDYLFTAVRFGKTTLAELSSNFGRLAGVSAPVGASIQDMVAAIATLTRQGIRTDWAITSLRQTLMQFIKPVKNLKLAIKDLGYSSGPAMIKALGFANALKVVTEYAEENGIEMEQMFTNVRAITAVLPLATTAAAGYAQDLERMANSSGAATAAFEKQTKSWAFQIQKFTTLLNDFAISLGEILMPAIKGVMLVVEGLTTVLRPLISGFKLLGGDLLLGVVSTAGVLALALWGVHKALVAVNLALTTGIVGASNYGAAIGAVLYHIGTGSMLAGAGMLLGGALAGALSVKTLINFDLELGKVSWQASAAKALWQSILSIGGLAAAGFVVGGGVGAAIGAAIGTIGVVINVIHEVYDYRQTPEGQGKVMTEEGWILPREFTTGQSAGASNRDAIAAGASAATAFIDEWRSVLDVEAKSGTVSASVKNWIKDAATFTGGPEVVVPAVESFFATIVDEFGLEFAKQARGGFSIDWSNVLALTAPQVDSIGSGFDPILKRITEDFDNLYAALGRADIGDKTAAFAAIGDSLSGWREEVQTMAVVGDITAEKAAYLTGIIDNLGISIGILPDGVLSLMEEFKRLNAIVNDVNSSGAAKADALRDLVTMYSEVTADTDILAKYLNMTDGELIAVTAELEKLGIVLENIKTLAQQISEVKLTDISGGVGQAFDLAIGDLVNMLSGGVENADIGALTGLVGSLSGGSAAIETAMELMERTYNSESSDISTAAKQRAREIHGALSVFLDVLGLTDAELAAAAQAAADKRAELVGFMADFPEQIAELQRQLAEGKRTGNLAMEMAALQGLEGMAGTFATSIENATGELVALNPYMQKYLDYLVAEYGFKIDAAKASQTIIDQYKELKKQYNEAAIGSAARAEALQGLLGLYPQSIELQELMASHGEAVNSEFEAMISYLLGLGPALAGAVSAFQLFISEIKYATAQEATQSVLDLIEKARSGGLTLQDLSAGGQSISSIQSELESARVGAYRMYSKSEANRIAGVIDEALAEIAEVLGKPPEELQKELEESRKTAAEEREKAITDFWSAMFAPVSSADIPDIAAMIKDLVSNIPAIDAAFWDDDKSAIDAIISKKNELYSDIEAAMTLGDVATMDAFGMSVEDTRFALDKLKFALGDLDINPMLTKALEDIDVDLPADSVFSDLQDVFIEFPEHMKEIAKYGRGLVDQYREEAKELRTLAGATEDQIAEADALTTKADALERAFGDVVAAVNQFQLSLEGFSLGGLAGSLPELTRGMIGDLSGLGPDTTWQEASELIGFVASTSGAVEALGIKFQELANGPLGSTNPLFRQWADQTSEFLNLFGKTDEQIASDLDAAQKKADDAAKKAADAAVQAAKDSAQAAQDAFKDQFKKPILEGIRTGDWKAAADAVSGFAQSGAALMDLAANLSSANGDIIDEIEVLGLIVGASSELMSTIDSMILMGNIAGDDVSALEKMKWAIEGILDPLKQFKRELLENIIVNPGQFGEAYGGRLRAMIPKMATGGRVDTEGYAYLHEGEDVIPAGVSALSTPTSSACSGGVCPIPDDLFDESAAMMAQASANVVASFEDVTSAAEANAESSTDVVFGFEKFSEELGYVLDSFSVVEGWASDMESVGLYEQANYLSDALKIARDGFIEAVSGLSAMTVKVINSLKELATSISGIVRSAFKDLFRSLFDLSSSAEETSNSLNVPSGYKVERAAWAAATPGEPGDPMGGEEGFSLADWAAQLGADILGAITDALVDFAWDNFIEPLTADLWENIIKPFVWDDFIVDFLWEDIIVGFLWEDVIQPFLWEPIIAPAITWITNFVTALTSGTATVAGFALGVAGFMILLVALGAIIGTVIGVLALLWGAIQGIGDLLTAFFAPIIEAVGWAWEALTPLIDGARKLFGSLAPVLELFGEVVAFGIKLVIPLFAALGPVLSYIGEVIGFVAGAIKLIWDNTLGPVLNFFATAVEWSANAFVAALDVLFWPFKLVGAIVYNLYVAINNAIEWISHSLNPFSSGNQLEYRPIPALASGGFVTATGAALVHKGEVVAPAGTSPLNNYGSGGMMIENVMVVDGEVLYRATKKVNRQEQLRRTGSSIGGRAWQGA